MAAPDRIEREIDLANSPEVVWRALTTAEGLGTWFGTHARIDLRPGGQAHVTWSEDDQATLDILLVDPPHRFAFTWATHGLPPGDPRRTHVEFTLEPIAAGTRLRVTESGFAQLPDGTAQRAYETNRQGWRSELAELATYLNDAA